MLCERAVRGKDLGGCYFPRRLLTFYGSGQKGVVSSSVEACRDLAPRAVWIDLLKPTREEELAVERALGIEIPTREEMQEIELSRRLYREKDVLYMTASVLTKSDTSLPESSAITFVLTPEKLLTLRYADPVAFQNFVSHWNTNEASFASAPAVLAGLVDAMVERLADILENTAAGFDKLSREVFVDDLPQEGAPATNPHRSPPKRDFNEVLRRIGRHSDLASKARDSVVSIGRLIAFIREAEQTLPALKELSSHVKTVATDLTSLGDFANFLSGKGSFLLDATLGLISNEQNAIIKVVSVAALVFGPPTLIASIYGMNFAHMPELQWLLGYPFAIAMMIIAAVFPYVWFKRKGWL